MNHVCLLNQPGMPILRSFFHVNVDSVFDLLAREREELAAQLQGDAHESEEDSSPAFEDIMNFWERVSNQVRTRTWTWMFQWKDEPVLNL